MENNKEQDNQYEGEQVEGVPQGKGKQILISKGMTFNGLFQEGKKHGPGYLVNEHLNTMECEFLNDQLTGIWSVVILILIYMGKERSKYSNHQGSPPWQALPFALPSRCFSFMWLLREVWEP